MTTVIIGARTRGVSPGRASRRTRREGRAGHVSELARLTKHFPKEASSWFIAIPGGSSVRELRNSDQPFLADLVTRRRGLRDQRKLGTLGEERQFVNDFAAFAFQR